MSTTLQIELSDQMQAWLATGGAGNGVSAYAILYGSATAGGDANSPLAWQPLVSDGAVQAGGSVSMALTSATQATLYGGKVYFLIQSLDDGDPAIDPATLKQSDITWANAASLNYRYDSMEVSLTGTPGDAANLTSIEGFGIGMSLSAATGTRGYAASASQMFGWLADAATDPTPGLPAVSTFTAGGLAGQSRQAVSPAIAVVPANDYPLYAASDWDNYIDALKTPQTRIVINGYFNGAGDLQAGAAAGTPVVWRNAGFFSYALEWSEAEGTFWLTPTLGSQIQGAIRLTPDTLADSVYSTLGTVQIYDTIFSPAPFAIYPGATGMNAGANNAWGQVLQQLTLGLTAGYLQSSGASPNAAVTAAVDLNKNYNWSPVYAYGTGTTSALGPDVTVRWDPYSQLFYAHSNSYGTQYADALMNAYTQGGPQLATFDNGQNVATMTVTLFADAETPPAGAYTPPVIQDYVAGSGPGGQYEAAEWHAGNGTNITLNFNPGDSLAQSQVLRDDVQLSMRILTGYSAGTPQWQEVAIGGKGQTPWQNWTFGYADGAYSLSGNGGAGQTSQSLVLTGIPMADSGTGWYQIVVAAPGFEKVFNLYTTTFTPAPTTGDPDPIPQFSNFGDDPSLFGIDGLAVLTPGATQPGGGLLTFSVNVTGVSPTIDLSLMRANTSSGFLANQVVATAPVAGNLHAGAFVALAGQDADVHQASGAGADLALTSTDGTLAFGWTGLNNAPDTSSWTQTFTNLVQARSIAVVDITLQGGKGDIAPMHGKADITGAWHTATTQLGNGTYDVTMTGYLPQARSPGMPDMDAPLTSQSASLTLTVQLADLALRAAADGAALALAPDGSGTDGNWIHFGAAAGTLPRGASIAFYATDAAGNPVDADGRPVASAADAVLGWVGAVGSDSGLILIEGSQSIYLPVGLQLRFGHPDGQGGITPAGRVDMRANGDGSFTLGIGDVTLLAEIDNTLTPTLQQAAVQRIYGLPLVHLEHGQQVEVSMSGSAHNSNTLGFVRYDLDPLEGEASIGGIAHDAGDAFRQAARAALDAGFAATVGGGDFAQTRNWTVAGEDGYYAPVLITQSGEIFVPGTGNSGGREYIRTFGANTFGFEDLTAAQGADFDYNDLVMAL
ncbi:MAG TPA: hypothetical protein VN329_14960, partial [Roseomonas sp.]|nr:hypothetical protein [Roseomonas sp.]